MDIHTHLVQSKSRSSRGFSLVEVTIVIAITVILAVLALPLFPALERTYRSSGDGRDLYSQIALAKMRASADFTHARVYVDLTANSMHLEVWNSTSSTWTTEGATQTLSSGDSFGYGSLSSAPPNTQGSFGQAAACRNDANTADIANTACIVFNSRGIPIDSNGPTGQDALYMTDGKAAYGVTVSATGLLRFWTSDIATANWTQQ
jgi:prepilin-type N-terminal cleavage/methylation domain-containing protein